MRSKIANTQHRKCGITVDEIKLLAGAAAGIKCQFKSVTSLRAEDAVPRKKVLQRNSNFRCFRPKRQIRWRCIKKNYLYLSLGYQARALPKGREVESSACRGAYIAIQQIRPARISCCPGGVVGGVLCCRSARSPWIGPAFCGMGQHVRRLCTTHNKIKLRTH